LGIPDVSGREAKTAAANPRGSITVINFSESFADFKNDNFTAANRRPRKTKAKNNQITQGR